MIFIKNLILLTAVFLTVVTAAGFSAKSSYAVADTVTVCHVPPDPDQTLEISESALSAHLGHGDTEGPCPVPPVVPEFGLITGGLALAASAGSYFLMKRRVSK